MKVQKCFKVEEEILELIKEIAKEEERSESQIIRMLVIEALKERGYIKQ